MPGCCCKPQITGNFREIALDWDPHSVLHPCKTGIWLVPFSVVCCHYYCLVPKSCPTLLQPHGLQPARLLCLWDFPGRNMVKHILNIVITIINETNDVSLIYLSNYFLMIVIYIGECIEKSGLSNSLSGSIIFAIFWERNLVMYIKILKMFIPSHSQFPF